MKIAMKYFKIMSLICLSAFSLIFLLNSFDGRLHVEVSEILQKNMQLNELEEKKCAALLGLVADPSLDSLAMGFKTIEKIKANSQQGIKFERAFEPVEIDKIESKEKCENGCRYSSGEVQRLKGELTKQRVFLSRFEKLMDFGNVQCQTPEIIFRLKLSGFLSLAKNKILEYKLLAQEGRIDDAVAGLQKMNQFFEQSLLAEKYSFILGMININILTNVREALVSIKGNHKNIIQFQALKYEDIVRKVQTGELQLTAFLFKKPIDYRFFEMADIADNKDNKSAYGITLIQSVIDKLTNYFFLPNETVNEIYDVLQKSAWHPCVGQKDIKCDIDSPSIVTWVRNPVGKSLNKMMNSNMAASFQKLKSK